MTTREKAHKLLDELPESEIAPVLGSSSRADAVMQMLDRAPLEDEEISPEEDAAAAESRAELAAGAPTFSVEQVKRELGDA